MPKNARKKARVREIMAEEGLTYTQALRVYEERGRDRAEARSTAEVPDQAESEDE